MAKSKALVHKTGTEALAQWDEELAREATEQASKESIGSSRLSVRGGKFSVGGNTLKCDELPVVVIEHLFENAYYEGKFDPDNPASPVCYAYGTDKEALQPHEKSSDPQCEACAACKQNQFGTADTGRGKACKNVKRLLVISGSEVSAESLRDGEALFLSVPVTSYQAWAHYVKGLAATYRRPAWGVVTELTITPDPKTQFKLGFRFKELLSPECLAVAKERRQGAVEALTQPYPDPQEKPAAKPARGRSGRKEKF